MEKAGLSFSCDSETTRAFSRALARRGRCPGTGVKQSWVQAQPPPLLSVGPGQRCALSVSHPPAGAAVLLGTREPMSRGSCLPPSPPPPQCTGSRRRACRTACSKRDQLPLSPSAAGKLKQASSRRCFESSRDIRVRSGPDTLGPARVPESSRPVHSCAAGCPWLCFPEGGLCTVTFPGGHGLAFRLEGLWQADRTPCWDLTHAFHLVLDHTHLLCSESQSSHLKGHPLSLLEKEGNAGSWALNFQRLTPRLTVQGGLRWRVHKGQRVEVKVQQAIERQELRWWHRQGKQADWNTPHQAAGGAGLCCQSVCSLPTRPFYR